MLCTQALLTSSSQKSPRTSENVFQFPVGGAGALAPARATVHTASPNTIGHEHVLPHVPHAPLPQSARVRGLPGTPYPIHSSRSILRLSSGTSLNLSGLYQRVGGELLVIQIVLATNLTKAPLTGTWCGYLSSKVRSLWYGYPP